MKLRSILACYRDLPKGTISRRDLYSLAHDGKLPTVEGKSTPEAILSYLQSALGIAVSPERNEGRRQRIGCNADGSKRSRGRKSALQSSGQSRNGGSEK